MPTTREKLLLTREQSRRCYHRHKGAAKRRIRAYRTEERAHGWYEDGKEWFAATKRLRLALRPDISETARLKSKFPLLDVEEVMCDNADELQEYYKVKIRELRILYGRDPDTGWVAKDRSRIPESEWTPGYRRLKELAALKEQREREEEECPSPS